MPCLGPPAPSDGVTRVNSPIFVIVLRVLLKVGTSKCREGKCGSLGNNKLGPHGLWVFVCCKAALQYGRGRPGV